MQFKHVVDRSEPLTHAVTVDPAKDVAVLQYTGGTTGISKGAMLLARQPLSQRRRRRPGAAPRIDRRGPRGPSSLPHLRDDHRDERAFLRRRPRCPAPALRRKGGDEDD